MANPANLKKIYHPPQEVRWVLFKRAFKLLAPIPYKYTIPDLKLLKI